ncbi:HSP20 family molecular chaperone IbpA [Paucimonas lemoignei]|uniref:HSP20 family molecular chaperone IbpA n=1 Tax=Paucimonas lemoignei TaxID=29443 RepID=A0A4V2UI96_PAULE|nr:Hsp20 family protein [Paucimonas lemoignei]TCS34701.1 HSP20 family molecular chaperone IbpA [Paucimonas lemoignei]
MTTVERSIEVNVPISVAYRKLNEFEEFPRFMKGVHSVHQLDESHLHWRAEKGGKEMEWDAEITENIPEKCIAWRNTSGPKNEGRVEFHVIDQEKTRISLHMEADEESLRHPFSIYSDSPQDDGDLARFKKMVESQSKSASVNISADGTPASASAAARESGMSGADTRSAVGASHSSGMSGSGASGAGTASSTSEHKTAQGSASTARQTSGMPQSWDDPLRIVRKMGEEMEQFLGRWISPGGSMRKSVLPLSRTAGEWTPPVDIEQHDGQVHICADLPGVSKEDVQIEIVRGQLLIEGERRGGLGRHRQEYRQAECNRGHFYRSIPLPEGADPDSAKASMHDGVLDITLQVASIPNHARRLNIQG